MLTSVFPISVCQWRGIQLQTLPELNKGSEYDIALGHLIIPLIGVEHAVRLRGIHMLQVPLGPLALYQLLVVYGPKGLEYLAITNEPHCGMMWENVASTIRELPMPTLQSLMWVVTGGYNRIINTVSEFPPREVQEYNVLMLKSIVGAAPQLSRLHIVLVSQCTVDLMYHIIYQIIVAVTQQRTSQKFTLCVSVGEELRIPFDTALPWTSELNGLQMDLAFDFRKCLESPCQNWVIHRCFLRIEDSR